MKTSEQKTDDLTRTGLSVDTWSQIRAVLSKVPEVEQAVLYGSRALGTQHKASDIDLTLIGDVTHHQLNHMATDLDDLLLPWKIDLSVFSEISNSQLIEHIRRVGVTVYQRN